ncbi:MULTISPECIES: trypsin-like serine peptidase [unclassified Roseivivax]|uniref:trypsin-like serine peptidase n=1 Tax=Roseivivax sp. GX 12232 TaxID=2900547 RepID=UPI001E5B76EB|nr:trypsin-like serine protease [Roseivivax sp. GX 12232]MCE0505434.1 trypsin-like serine protease [Roseivivax sp. GX 12232]
MPRRLALALLGLFLAQPLSAQGLFSLGPDAAGGAWDSVGRLEISGKTFCTGALIAPDLVLTAAHCLYDRASGAPVAVEEVQFLAGWRNGRAAAYRRVRRAIAHPDYDFSLPSGPARVRNDIALLKLQHPIQNTTITPFETDADPARGDSIGVVSYARGGADVPALEERCAVLSKQQGVVVMSCRVDFGSSGSPVFSFASGVPRVVSIVSAKAEAEGAPVSLGVSVEAALPRLQAALAEETRRARLPGIKSVTETGSRASAAKFLRP